MDELNSILCAVNGLHGPNCDAVLATVVHVSGSTYRRPGARMLILPDGLRVGCVSGGCLEGEISRKAWWFTENGSPAVRVYDTTSDDDAVWEFGLGCNGVVHVLLERVNGAGTSQALEFLHEQRLNGRPVVLATVIGATEHSRFRVGDRLLVDENLHCSGNLNQTHFRAAILEHAAAAFVERKSCLMHLEEIDVFVEYVGLPLRLVIFGAGHDAIPLVRVAAELGWDITVADGRPSYAKRERFPAASRVVTISNNDPLQDIPLDADTAVVMMTHNFPMDCRLLPAILQREPRYIGLLGPKTRAERLFQQLDVLPANAVHAPAGLDIGSDSPAAIALSIVAEIQAVVNNRPGKMLKLRTSPIHVPATEIGQKQLGAIETDRPFFCETLAGSHA